MTATPLISVVIPSFNQGRFIEQTITSVLGQNYPCKELIVIDGGSTDETVEIINNYADQIGYWVSEKDNGEGDAINKGLRHAKGDILAWLNSDDYYLPCALSKVAEALEDFQRPGLAYGGAIHFTDGRRGASAHWPPEFDAHLLTTRDYIMQPAAFWTRALASQIGEINASLHYVLDWDWYLRAAKVCTFTPIWDYLAMYRHHGRQKTSGNMKRAHEILQLLDQHADEQWRGVYHDVVRHASTLRWRLNAANRLRLSRVRELVFPSLYFKYGRERVDTALAQLAL